MYQKVSQSVFNMAKDEFLDKEAMLKVIRKYKRTKDEDEKEKIRDIIVKNNVRLVIKIAQSYANKYNLNADDAFQNGVIGVMVALDRFKAGKRMAFSTYAYYWIDNFIRRSVDDEKLINTHRYLKTGVGAAPIYFQCLREAEGDIDKFMALLRKRKVTQKQQNKIEQVLAMSGEGAFIDIHAHIGDDDSSSRVIDVIEDKASLAPDVEAFDNIVREKILDCIEHELKPDEKKVIRALFFSENPQIPAVCKIIGKSRVTVQKIKKRALDKLAKSLGRNKKFVIVSFHSIWNDIETEKDKENDIM